MMLAYCSAYYSTYQAFFSKELRYSSHDFLLVTFIHATITRPHKLGRVAQRKKKSKKFYCLIMYVLGVCMKGTQNCQKWNNIWSHIGGQLHPKNIYLYDKLPTSSSITGTSRKPGFGYSGQSRIRWTFFPLNYPLQLGWAIFAAGWAFLNTIVFFRCTFSI